MIGPVRARKSLGQNFLVDPNLQRKVVDALEASEADQVLEIGPGKGALTDHLVGRVKELVLVEVDPRLATLLADRYADDPTVRVEQGDFLDGGLGGRVEEPERVLVVGSIPYNVTTPILFELLTRPRPRRAVLVVQKEVAERLVAEVGSSAYGALTVGVRSVARVEKVWSLPRSAFRPVPGVDSAAVRIDPIHPPRLTEEEERALRALTRIVFQWRRKQMRRILRDHPGVGVAFPEIETLAGQEGWDLTRRPETFSPDELMRLAIRLREAQGGEWPFTGPE